MKNFLLRDLELLNKAVSEESSNALVKKTQDDIEVNKLDPDFGKPVSVRGVDDVIMSICVYQGEDNLSGNILFIFNMIYVFICRNQR